MGRGQRWEPRRGGQEVYEMVAMEGFCKANGSAAKSIRCVR